MDSFSRELLALSKKILAELHGLSAAILGVQKQISSIRDQHEAAYQQQEKEQQPPPILQAKLQIPEDVQQEKRTSDKRHLAVQVVLAVVTFLAFLAAGIYAGINYHMLCEMRKANKQAAQSLAVQTRPWIGLEGSRVAPVSSPEYTWGPLLPYPMIYVNLSYSVKNYGAGPGFREREWIKVTPVSDVGGYTPTFPDECLMAETHQPSSDKVEAGQVIFPGATIETKLATNMMTDVQRTKDLRRVWISLCVAYQDSRDQWHHSRYRYISTSATGRPTLFQTIPAGLICHSVRPT